MKKEPTNAESGRNLITRNVRSFRAAARRGPRAIHERGPPPSRFEAPLRTPIRPSTTLDAVGSISPASASGPPVASGPAHLSRPVGNPNRSGFRKKVFGAHASLWDWQLA